MDLPFRIPDILLPILFGALLWFGCVYFFITPALTERVIDIHVREECEGHADQVFCDCLFEHFWERGASIKSTLFLSTFSLSEPRISLFDTKRNPYVEYVSYQMKKPKLRTACDTTGNASLRLAEKRATEKIEEKHKKELAEIEKQHKEKMAQEKLKNSEHQKVLEVANAVKNSKVGQYLQEEAERVKRANELRERTTDVGLNVWESTLDWVEKKRRHYERRNNYE